eukprot:2766009-Heterocapsa_arctica.AAC.1
MSSSWQLCPSQLSSLVLSGIPSLSSSIFESLCPPLLLFAGLGSRTSLSMIGWSDHPHLRAAWTEIPAQ